MELLYWNEIFHTFTFEPNQNLFGLDHTKHSTDFLLSRLNFFPKMVLHFIHNEIIWYRITRKNFFCTLIFETSCVFQSHFNITFHNQLNMPIATHPLLNQMNPFLMNNHQKTISHHLTTQNLYYSLQNQITPLLISLQMTTHLWQKMTTQLSNKYLKHLKLIHPLTDRDTAIKTKPICEWEKC